MSNTIDEAFGRFSSLRAAIVAVLAKKPNEADTRLKALDRILFEVLNWKHEAVFTEPPTESGYIDYLLTVGERRNVLVIEAKKAGLLSPATKSDAMMTVAMNGPVVKPLQAGIRQALGYANEKGVPVAVLTDGHTWLFFRASRIDGKPPLEGKGILFPSLKAVDEYFGPFVEMLAPSAVIDRSHLAHLSDAEGLAIIPSEQHFFVFPPLEAKMRHRDPLASDASLLFSQFFSRLSNDQDREMLRECFVETAESKKADLELEKIIQKVMNNVSAIGTANGGALQAELERALTTRRSESVLLIGNKGSGKSTFIDRFFETVLPLGVRKRCVVARVDLSNYPGSAEDIVKWSILQLRNLLEAGVCTNNPPSYDDLQGIFYAELKRLKNGPMRPLFERDPEQFRIQFGQHIEIRRESRPDEYVRLLLDWASRGQNKLPCLVFDNTDQFPIEVQDAVYQLAHSLESAAPVFNIVPITDRTVWRLSQAGALQSYAAKSFFLPVPDAKEIISWRVMFLKKKLKADKNASQSYFSKKGFSVQLNDLAMLAEAVEQVFVANDYVSGLIGRLGNFDIRRMLKLAERIFLSPEIAIDDIIKSKFGGPVVTTDRFRTHRALIKGEYDRFSEAENEFVSNMFVTNAAKPPSPLLAFYILRVLRHKLVNARSESIEASHWLVADICDYFEACGVSEELVLQVLRRLYDRRMIEGIDPNLKEIGMSDRVTVKESGVAHIERVTSSSVYVEQMALTTGVNELVVRDEIRTRAIQRTGTSFTEIRDIFLRYLLNADSGKMLIPSTPPYAQVIEARRQVQNLSAHDRSQGFRRPRRGQPYGRRNDGSSYNGRLRQTDKV